MLRSTFYGFNIAFSGLMKSQKALDLTGNNISNASTPGFTRQRLDLVSFPSSSYTDRYAPFNNIAIGQGVNVTRVAQIRDPFLDARFRREASNIGELDSHLSALRDIATIFDEVQFEALNKAFEDFRSQLHVYSTQTGQVMIDTTVWAAAESIIKMFSQYSRQIADVRDYHEFLLSGPSVDGGLKGGHVSEVNSILKNLAVLNKNIRECEIHGNPALELRDQRNMLLDQLSAFMKIEVKYEKDPDPILAKMGVEVCTVTFVGDKSNQTFDTREEYTLVDGHRNVTLGVHKDSSGEVRIFKEFDLNGNPVTDKGGQQFYYGPSVPAEDPPGTLLYVEIGGLKRQLFLENINPALNGELAFAAGDPENPLPGINLYFGPGVPVLDKDGNTMIDSNGMQLFYESDDPALNDERAATISEGLMFEAGALKGALEMLNSKGAFDVPPNTLNGIGYYEIVLNRIVEDFAKMMNEANSYLDAPLVPPTSWMAWPKVKVDDWEGPMVDLGSGPEVDPAWLAWLTTSGVAYTEITPGEFNIADYAAYMTALENDPTLNSTIKAAWAWPQQDAPSWTVAVADTVWEDWLVSDSGLAAGTDYTVVTGTPNEYTFLDQTAYFAALNGMDDSLKIKYPDKNWDGINPPPAMYYDRPMFTPIDPDFPMTANNIQIAPDWKNGTYNLTTSKSINLPGDFTGDTSNLLYIISLLDDKHKFTTAGIEGFPGNDISGAQRLYTGSFEDMFKNIGLIAAQDVKSKTVALNANTHVIWGVEDMRNSLSSVSMDEEGVNLLRFQKSYAANARVMTTLDEALDVLINRLGIVGR